MNDVIVRSNGQEGVWLANAIGESITDNLVESNAQNQTTDSGIQVGTGSQLDAGDDGFNTIKNNTYHEITVSSTGLADLGTHSGGTTGGNNNIYDVNTPTTGEYYINNTTSSPVFAEQNCWNTPSAPPSALFSGSVDRAPFVSCSGLSKSPISDSRNGFGGDLIAAALSEFEAMPNQGHLAEFYMRVVFGGADGLAFEDELDRVLGAYRINSEPRGAVNDRVREFATVLELRELIRKKRYEEAKGYFQSFADKMTSNDLSMDFLLLGVSAYTMVQEYVEALVILERAQEIQTSDRDISAEASFLTEELLYRLKEDKGLAGAELDARLTSARFSKNALEGHEAPIIASSSLRIWPNPSSGSITVRIESDEPAYAAIRVVDALGRVVLTPPQVALSGGTTDAALELGTLSSGIFLIEAIIYQNDGRIELHSTTATKN